MAHMLPYSSSVRITSLAYVPVFPGTHLLRLHAAFHSAPMLSTHVPTVLSYCSTGISTCCPSATPLSLALGPDLPGADQLYSGNLGYSATGIPTLFSLLIPAFSLPVPPPLLSVRLRRSGMLLYQSLNVIPELRCRVSAPDIFGAGTLDQ